MPFFDQIKASLPAIRRRKGLTQQATADLVGLKIRQYQNIEQTGKTTLGTLSKIADALEVNLSELMQEEKNIDMRKQKEVYRIPVVNSIPASGFVRSFEDMISEDYIYTTIKRKGLFALIVKGDSMSPRIEEGDLVVLEPHPEFHDNTIYAIIAGDSEATLKTVKKVQGGYLCIPMNQAFETLFVPDKKMIRLYKVVQIVKTIR